ncbi:MAG: hypothetical protein K8L97_18790 [Anaerolineae bacterium]|nr:hypothetical protein [Anaerolineae bacterium]
MKKYTVGAVLLVVGLALGALAITRILPMITPGVVCPNNPELPVGGIWTEGANMPTARAETAATSLGERIYVAGGMVSPWVATAIHEIYDTTTNTWQSAAPMPIAINHSGVASALGRIYVTGGYDVIGKMVDAKPDIAQGWYYDPEADSWTEIAPMPSPRAAHAMVNIEDKLYVVGGTGAGALEVWVYDPAADTWEIREGLMQNAREHVPAVVLDGKIYVVGGRWQNISTAAVEVYDPATDSWTQAADVPTPRSALSVAVLDGKIHTVGGEELSNSCTYGLHEMYDPATDEWTELQNMPTPRHAMLSAVIDDKWYLIGGASEAGPRTDAALSGVVEVFTPET